MSIKKIIVTGANGQLGWEIAQIAKQYHSFDFEFLDRSQLDLSNLDQVENVLEQLQPDCIINTAAFTAVDKAETEQVLANTVNASAVELMAKWAATNQAIFITYSTDYVFNGQATMPYQINTLVDPINYYGASKAIGEKLAMAANPNAIIIRTSWVFSSHGNNFVKTMLRLMKERNSLNIVADQKGRPTYARDLAHATIKMIEAIDAGKNMKGFYHYANRGETTWFDFAKAINQMAGLDCQLVPIQTVDFPTPAKRPAYSVLDTSKIEQDLGFEIPEWETALQNCYQQILNA